MCWMTRLKKDDTVNGPTLQHQHHLSTSQTTRQRRGVAGCEGWAWWRVGGWGNMAGAGGGCWLACLLLLPWMWEREKKKACHSGTVWFVHVLVSRLLLFIILPFISPLLFLMVCYPPFPPPFLVCSAMRGIDKNWKEAIVQQQPPYTQISLRCAFDRLRQILLFRWIVKGRKTRTARERGELVTVATRRVTLAMAYTWGRGVEG